MLPDCTCNVNPSFQWKQWLISLVAIRILPVSWPLSPLCYSRTDVKQARKEIAIRNRPNSYSAFIQFILALTLFSKTPFPIPCLFSKTPFPILCLSEDLPSTFPWPRPKETCLFQHGYSLEVSFPWPSPSRPESCPEWSTKPKLDDVSMVFPPQVSHQP